MAKLYGNIASSALMTFDKSFARANGQPLDATEVYYSLTDAQAYAAGAGAYVGQKIVVIENGIVTHYGIADAEGTLKELGAKPVADGTTVSIGDDGKITLANIAEKAEGTYNAVLVNGVLTWVEPSKTTVEGLSDLITALTGRVDAHDEAIEQNAEDIKTIADDYLKAVDKTELSGAIAAEKERAEAAEAGLQTQINTIMNNPDAEGAINSINEFAQYVKDHGTVADGFRADINKNKEDIATEAARAAAAEEANADAIADLEAADEAIVARIDALEEYDHDSYATKEALDEVATTAGNAATKVGNLEGRINDIVATGGEPNTINTIKVNGEVQTIAEDKSVNIAVPTKFSDISDDSGFDARIIAAQNAANTAQNTANDAAAAATTAQGEVDALEIVVGGIQTTVAGHTTAIADHTTRIAELEAADIAHKAEYEALNSVVGGHITAIAGKAEKTELAEVASQAGANKAAIETINEVTLPALETEVAKKADASALNAYYTKEEVDSAVENVVGDIAGNKTIVELIEEAKTAATYDDAEVKQMIANEVARAEAAEGANAQEIARVNSVLVAALDNKGEGLDSIKELADWINKHGSDAADMVADITANTNAIAAINDADKGIAAVAKKYTDDAIAGLPAATVDALGLVKFDNTTIKMNDNKQLYVAEVSTDLLKQGTETLVLHGGSATE